MSQPRARGLGRPKKLKKRPYTESITKESIEQLKRLMSKKMSEHRNGQRRSNRARATFGQSEMSPSSGHQLRHRSTKNSTKRGQFRSDPKPREKIILNLKMPANLSKPCVEKTRSNSKDDAIKLQDTGEKPQVEEAKVADREHEPIRPTFEQAIILDDYFDVNPSTPHKGQRRLVELMTQTGMDEQVVQEYFEQRRRDQSAESVKKTKGKKKVAEIEVIVLSSDDEPDERPDSQRVESVQGMEGVKIKEEGENKKKKGVTGQKMKSAVTKKDEKSASKVERSDTTRKKLESTQRVEAADAKRSEGVTVHRMETRETTSRQTTDRKSPRIPRARRSFTFTPSSDDESQKDERVRKMEESQRKKMSLRNSDVQFLPVPRDLDPLKARRSRRTRSFSLQTDNDDSKEEKEEKLKELEECQRKRMSLRSSDAQFLSVFPLDSPKARRPPRSYTPDPQKSRLSKEEREERLKKLEESQRKKIKTSQMSLRSARVRRSAVIESSSDSDFEEETNNNHTKYNLRKTPRQLFLEKEKKTDSGPRRTAISELPAVPKREKQEERKPLALSNLLLTHKQSSSSYGGMPEAYFNRIVNYLLNDVVPRGECEKKWRTTMTSFKLIDGALYREIGNREKLVLFQNEIEAIARFVHIHTGHTGSYLLYLLLDPVFTYGYHSSLGSLKSDVDRFVRSCEVCREKGSMHGWLHLSDLIGSKNAFVSFILSANKVPRVVTPVIHGLHEDMALAHSAKMEQQQAGKSNGAEVSFNEYNQIRNFLKHPNHSHNVSARVSGLSKSMYLDKNRNVRRRGEGRPFGPLVICAPEARELVEKAHVQLGHADARTVCAQMASLVHHCGLLTLCRQVTNSCVFCQKRSLLKTSCTVGPFPQKNRKRPAKLQLHIEQPDDNVQPYNVAQRRLVVLWGDFDQEKTEEYIRTMHGRFEGFEETVSRQRMTSATPNYIGGGVPFRRDALAKLRTPAPPPLLVDPATIALFETSGDKESDYVPNCDTVDIAPLAGSQERRLKRNHTTDPHLDTTDEDIEESSSGDAPLLSFQPSTGKRVRNASSTLPVPNEKTQGITGINNFDVFEGMSADAAEELLNFNDGDFEEEVMFQQTKIDAIEEYLRMDTDDESGGGEWMYEGSQGGDSGVTEGYGNGERFGEEYERGGSSVNSNIAMDMTYDRSNTGASPYEEDLDAVLELLHEEEGDQQIPRTPLREPRSPESYSFQDFFRDVAENTVPPRNTVDQNQQNVDYGIQNNVPLDADEMGALNTVLDQDREEYGMPVQDEEEYGSVDQILEESAEDSLLALSMESTQDPTTMDLDLSGVL